MTKFDAQKHDLHRAVARLEDILKEQKTEIVRDSAIKRFELAFDVCWKTLKTYLEEKHNVIANSPQSCFREAYKVGILEYDDFWIKIAEFRNVSVHTYKEDLAEEVYSALPKILTYFQKLETLLTS